MDIVLYNNINSRLTKTTEWLADKKLIIIQEGEAT